MWRFFEARQRCKIEDGYTVELRLPKRSQLKTIVSAIRQFFQRRRERQRHANPVGFDMDLYTRGGAELGGGDPDMVIEWTSGNTKNTYELTEHPLDTVQLSEDEASGTPEATSTGGDGGGDGGADITLESLINGTEERRRRLAETERARVSDLLSSRVPHHVYVNPNPDSPVLPQDVTLPDAPVASTGATALTYEVSAASILSVLEAVCLACGVRWSSGETFVQMQFCGVLARMLASSATTAQPHSICVTHCLRFAGHVCLCLKCATTGGRATRTSTYTCMSCSMEATFITPVRLVHPVGTIWDDDRVSPHAEVERERRRKRDAAPAAEPDSDDAAEMMEEATSAASATAAADAAADAAAAADDVVDDETEADVAGAGDGTAAEGSSEPTEEPVNEENVVGDGEADATAMHAARVQAGQKSRTAKVSGGPFKRPRREPKSPRRHGR